MLILSKSTDGQLQKRGTQICQIYFAFVTKVITALLEKKNSQQQDDSNFRQVTQIMLHKWLPVCHRKLTYFSRAKTVGNLSTLHMHNIDKSH